MIEIDVELAHDARAELGEGPVWDDERRELIWVDILAGRVWRFDPATGSARVLELGVPVGSVALREAGGFVLAVEDGFALLDDESESMSLVAPVERDRPANRMNDGKCDSAGRFWAGSMAYSEEPEAGTLYRLAPDRSAAVAMTGVTISSGIDWSPDGSLMYYVDSGHQRIDTFDFDPGTGSISQAQAAGRSRSRRRNSRRALRRRSPLRLGRSLGRRGREALQAGRRAGRCRRGPGPSSHQLRLWRAFA